MINTGFVFLHSLVLYIYLNGTRAFWGFFG